MTHVARHERTCRLIWTTPIKKSTGRVQGKAHILKRPKILSIRLQVIAFFFFFLKVISFIEWRQLATYCVSFELRSWFDETNEVKTETRENRLHWRRKKKKEFPSERLNGLRIILWLTQDRNQYVIIIDILRGRKNVEPENLAWSNRGKHMKSLAMMNWKGMNGYFKKTKATYKSGHPWPLAMVKCFSSCFHRQIHICLLSLGNSCYHLSITRVNRFKRFPFQIMTNRDIKVLVSKDYNQLTTHEQ